VGMAVVNEQPHFEVAGSVFSINIHNSGHYIFSDGKKQKKKKLKPKGCRKE
jgi:hypothetical protein